MKSVCAICGNTFEHYKGKAMYCPNCRGDIENLKFPMGGYRKAAEWLIQDRAVLRQKNLKKKTMQEVIEIANETGESYGYTVARIEGDCNALLQFTKDTEKERCLQRDFR